MRKIADDFNQIKFVITGSCRPVRRNVAVTFLHNFTACEHPYLICRLNDFSNNPPRTSYLEIT